LKIALKILGCNLSTKYGICSLSEDVVTHHPPLEICYDLDVDEPHLSYHGSTLGNLCGVNLLPPQTI
jgi:hypothetical protein